MCNFEWDAIAEFYLRTEDFVESEEIYCLCSRVFTWLDELCKDLSGSEGDFSKQNTDSFEGTLLECTDVKNCTDGEPVSCYCSASHTDNISTDEHDSLYDSHSTTQQTLVKVLHLSDSGTDLSDHVKRNNDAWQNYWALHGERLIWESWINKYSDYIDADYIHGNSNTQLVLVTGQQNQAVNDSSANDTAVEKNRMLIRNLSQSDSYDKLQQEGEGWNRLSPVSNECETEAERLLSSQCPSQNGSSVPTLDSMTNVTQLTLSSVDLSESSKNSEGLSSVSSIQSSVTSSSSVDVEECANYSQHWNVLWSEHYEDIYLQQYNKFISGDLDEFTTMEKTEEIDSAANDTQDYEIHKKASKNEDNLMLSVPSSTQKKHNRKHRSKVHLSKESYSSKEVELDNTVAIVDSLQADLEELKQMKHLGLPVSFSTSAKNSKKSTKRSLICDVNLDKNSSKRIKSVFNLIAMKMQEDGEKQLIGSVECETQHVRAQNRFLKLYTKSNFELTPKHIHFNDEGEVIDESFPQEIETTEVSPNNDLLALLASSTEDEIEVPILEELQTTSKPKKKRKRKNVPSEVKENPKLFKYWRRRYSLFSKFDQGIKLDIESWFSVTPEQIAFYTAERCRCDVIIDAFCGAGGNSIQFAFTCTKVIAIDIDPKKIELAKHNAEIYQVDNRIEFVVGDFFQLATSLKADVVFLSPPWGGPQYLNKSTYDLELLQPAPFSTLFETASKITPNIGIFLPRNANTYPLVMAAGPGGCVEIEQNFLGKKLVAITAYYGELVKETEKNNTSSNSN